MCALRIVADENMPLVKEFFEEFGEIDFLPGRSITADHVRDADILLVRSVTRVDEALLKGSRIRFVGTATIGFDHIDVAYLKQNKIGFACAPGCNASSVVEYVLSALLALSEQPGFDFRNKTVGIVGKGNIGSLLYKRLTGLGVTCVVNDPPQAGKGQGDFVSLDELLMRSDIVTIHTPLVLLGEYSTRHLFDEARLNQLKQNAILINTARGVVMDNQALLRVLKNRDDLKVVLDVWENEPNILAELLPYLSVATPHIAGTSLEGKTRGTEMVYKAACEYFGLPQRKKLDQFLPEAPIVDIDFSDDANADDAIRKVLHACYDVRSDDRALRLAADDKTHSLGDAFDYLRKHYPVRREFSTLKLALKNNKPEFVSALRILGLNVIEI